MTSFDSLYSQFGQGNGRDKSMLKNVYASPNKYTEKQIRDAYRSALRVSRRDERFYKDIGSDDEDLVFQEDRYNTARNTYQSGLNNLLIRAKATPAPAPAPAPVAAPKPPPTPAPTKTFNDRLAKIQSDNTAQNDKLLAQMAADRKNYEDLASKYEKSISAYQNAFNQGSSVGGQENALMINPAMSTARKKRQTFKGTSQFNRNLKISNVSI